MVTYSAKRLIKSSIMIIMISWIVLSFMIFINQRNLVFVPTKKYINTPELYNLSYENYILTTKDGEKINSWFIPHPNPHSTLLFLHGNGGNISTRLDSINIFHQLGLSVFIIDYRGYGNSSGIPSEEGTYIDAETAWLFLKNKMDIDTNNIIIFGRSLGGAIAIWLAQKYNPSALIVESSFTSIIDMGRYNYPYLPISLLAMIKYPSDERISSINIPKLFIHSMDDDIVPYKFGQQLFELAVPPKEFLKISGSHNNGFIMSGDKYINGINEFLNNYIKNENTLFN